MHTLITEPIIDPLRLSLIEALGSFERAYARWVETPLQNSKLTYARIRLLGVLSRKGPQIMSAISDELVVSPRNITALVDSLEAAKLVRRSPHPTDRRATVIELTTEGLETCTTMYTQHASAVSELFSNLSGDDQKELLRLLNVLGTELERRGIIDEYPQNGA